MVVLFLFLFVCLLTFLKSEGIVESTVYAIVQLICTQAGYLGLFRLV